MKKIAVAGLKVDAFAKAELIKYLGQRLRTGQKTFITTLYSEFLYAAMDDRKVLDLLNKADVAVADGIGVIWAAKYLSLSLTVKNYWLKIIQAFWQMVYSGAAILFKPSWIKTVIPEKIVGADLIWDLAELAAKNNWSTYLLGGFDDTPKVVGFKLREKYPNLKIAGASNKNYDDITIFEDLKNATPDMLFVAFGPIKQESWIAKNAPYLPVKLAIGLGGTFDYVAGKRASPPKFLRYIGLEWLYRLVTQPHRLKRIIKATFGLVMALVKYKVFTSLPYRKNVVSIILNKKGEALIARFNPEHPAAKFAGESPKSLGNYWQLPQGGVDAGEDIITAARREAKEETGLKNLEFIKISDQTHSYTWKSFRKLLTAQRWRYRGQKQNIVYFKFLGDNKEIKLDNYEFLEYKWVPLDQLDKAIHEEKMTLAKIAQADLNREPGLIKPS